jgi:TonB family protein
MSQVTQTVEPEFRNELGHLAVKVEGLRPPDVQFSFERQPKRMSSALAGSIGVHVAAGIFVILMTLYGPSPDFSQPAERTRLSKDIVWLNVPGPGGGGGGGGNQMKEPPRKIEMPGKDKITVPAAKQPDLTPQPPKNDPPKLEQAVTIPAMTMATGTLVLPGALEGTAIPTDSLGSGSGGGAGTGQGTGIGPGRGSGLGPGEGGGTGGGVYRPGNGIDLPRVLREVRPNYTADAMRAKVQGTVLIEAVVLPDGTVGQVQVVRSLDTVFGLDQEAVKAARQWRFAPGTRMGQPVAVLVTIELTFTLR